MDAARQKRRQAERRGHLAEFLAGMMLRLKGYRVLARRYKAKGGEVDLVAVKKGVIVFVEVKARSSHGAGVTAVTPQARRRIETAAAQFLRSRSMPRGTVCRYDLITVRNFSIIHHENAWRAGD